MQIASINNLSFYLELVREAREHIIAGDFSSWKKMKIEEVERVL
jgi:queuine tRNA-ribosyltransferase